MSVTDIFTNGRELFMNTILSGESITKIMTQPSPVCPLLGKEIILGNKLGEGLYGEVFKIKIPGSGSREYAVKRSDMLTQMFTGGGTRKSTTFLDLQNKYGIKAEKIIEYNNLKKTNPEDNVVGTIWIPTFMKGCLTKKITYFDRFDIGGKIEFVPNEHLCPPQDDKNTLKKGGNMGTSEFAISLLAGSLYRSGRSINFLNVFYFAACKDKLITDGSIVNQYTFMELVNSSVRKSIECLCERMYGGKPGLVYTANPITAENAMNSVVIQIIHSIYMMQHVYQIVHGDLHDDNVFLEFINEDTEWKGQKLIEADYYEYKVEGKSIYITGGRECPFIVKIGDWGLACKYSFPKIANMMTIETGYDQFDGNGPWLPNFYTEVYDMYYIIDILYNLNPSNDFISNIMSWMLDVPPGMPDAIKGSSIISNTGRPSIRKLSTPDFSHVSPKNLLLENSVMESFYKVPPAGSKIILLGE